MPKVVHCKKSKDPFVYIGRGSKWGNPYSHKEGTKALFVVATREEAISKYKEYLLSNPVLMGSLHELNNKDLGCYCSPLPCHGDVLLDLANEGLLSNK